MFCQKVICFPAFFMVPQICSIIICLVIKTFPGASRLASIFPFTGSTKYWGSRLKNRHFVFWSLRLLQNYINYLSSVKIHVAIAWPERLRRIEKVFGEAGIHCFNVYLKRVPKIGGTNKFAAAIQKGSVFTSKIAAGFLHIRLLDPCRLRV